MSLTEQINDSRSEMHRLAERYGYRSAEVLEASQALDGLIFEAQRRWAA